MKMLKMSQMKTPVTGSCSGFSWLGRNARAKRARWRMPHPSVRTRSCWLEISMTRRCRTPQNKWPVVWWTRTTAQDGGIRLPWVGPTKGICLFCASIRCGIALNWPVSHMRRRMWRYPITVRLSEHLRSAQLHRNSFHSAPARRAARAFMASIPATCIPINKNP